MIVKQTAVLLLLSLTFLKISPSPAAQALNGTLPRKPVKNSIHGRTTKIVGGYRCPIKKFPFLVSLRYFNADEHFCAGSLLSEFWILSALHCLQKRCAHNIEVIAGSSYAKHAKRNPGKEALQFSTISSCYYYPVVDDEEYDIALARLRKPILQTDNVGYVSLPFNLADEERPVEEICRNATVAGWGVQYPNSLYEEPISYPIAEYDSHLQCIHLPVISQRECALRSYTSILPSFFCTYLPMTDACHGDSGGPLMCNGHQYGIVSYGFGCAFSEFPGVYTNVTYFKNFIITTMESPFVNERSSAKALHAADLLSVVLIIIISELYLLH